MSDSKHTAGEWAIDGTQIVSASRPIALVHLKAGNDSEFNANAALLSAAPELLEACQLFISFYDSENGAADLSRGIGVARAAVAKAKGEK